MALASIEKLFVVTQEANLDRLIAYLQQKGWVEVIDSPQQIEVKKEINTLEELREKINQFEYIIGILAPKKQKITSASYALDLDWENIYLSLKRIEKEEAQVQEKIIRLEKEKEVRYQHVDEMLADLKRVKRDTSRVSRRQPVLAPETAEETPSLPLKTP